MTIHALCRFLGFGLLAVGVVGFFAPHFLSMHLTPWHNVIHLATGSLALYFGISGSVAGARRFAFVFGLVYFGLGLLGFVAPGITAQFLGHSPVPVDELAPDNAVHLVLGAAFMLASRARAFVRDGEQTPARAHARR